MRVYRVVIRPVVTSGAESVIVTKGEEEKLRRFKMNLRGKSATQRE